MDFQIPEGVVVKIVAAPLSAIVAVIALYSGQVNAVPVVPNFTQGSLTSRTETTQKITEVINSMDYNTGYQYSVSGSGITAQGTLSPTTSSSTSTIEGVTSTWTGLNSRPNFVQTIPGGAFQYTETFQGPGLSNQTIIQRETEIQSVTESTSIFTQ